MLTFLRILLGLVLLGVAVVLAMIFVPQRLTPPQQTLAADYAVPEGDGLYVMRTADCAACHTAEGGQPFAGGRPIQSPFGVIHSTNITSDKEHGIGNWSLDQFRAALYDGVDDEGHNLYPAMPSANYRKLTEPDVRALYAYFQSVPAVASDPAETNLAFPFNQRWGIRAWKWVAYGRAGFEPRLDDPVLDRGAYLVEGPGHCGACHSPRNAVFAQKGYTAKTKAFLAGGQIDGWSTPSLRAAGAAPQRWSVPQMVDFLKTGRNDNTGVAGEMHLVIDDSTQHMSDADLTAIATYLKHISLPSGAPAVVKDPDTTTAMLASAKPDTLGARLYLDNCNACHFSNGMGADGVFPELNGNSTVTAKLPKGLVSVILHGAHMPSTETRPAPLRMPGFAGRLSDAEVAELATFVRGAWSNSAKAVSVEEAAKVRKETAGIPQ